MGNDKSISIHWCQPNDFTLVNNFNFQLKFGHNTFHNQTQMTSNRHDCENFICCYTRTITTVGFVVGLFNTQVMWDFHNQVPCVLQMGHAKSTIPFGFWTPMLDIYGFHRGIDANCNAPI